MNGIDELNRMFPNLLSELMSSKEKVKQYMDPHLNSPEIYWINQLTPGLLPHLYKEMCKEECSNMHNTVSEDISASKIDNPKIICYNNTTDCERYDVGMSMLSVLITSNGIWMLSDSRSSNCVNGKFTYSDDYIKIVPVERCGLLFGSVGLNVFNGNTFNDMVLQTKKWADIKAGCTRSNVENYLKFSMLPYTIGQETNTVIISAGYTEKYLTHSLPVIKLFQIDHDQNIDQCDAEFNQQFTAITLGTSLARTAISEIDLSHLHSKTIDEEFSFLSNKFRRIIEFDHSIVENSRIGGKIVGYHLSPTGEIIRKEL